MTNPSSNIKPRSLPPTAHRSSSHLRARSPSSALELDRKHLLLGCCALVSLMGLGSWLKQSAPTPSTPLSAKYAPRNPNKLLFFVGQDLESINEYATNVANGSAPCGVTTYTTIQAAPHTSLHGLDHPVDYGAGTVHAKALLEKFPNSMLAIGLDIVDRSGRTLKSIANGSLDRDIDALGDFIARSNRPVFLRIGYEFEGPWNHYVPDLYIEAFRKIVNHLRHVRKISNFVSVWQSATSPHGTYGNRPISAWWPGEDVVDWLGSSYFVFHQSSWDNLVSFATRYRKPVLICESAPQGFDLGLRTHGSTTGNGDDTTKVSQSHIWRKWYAPFFQFVHSNKNIIRGVAYINCHWKAQNMWSPNAGNGYWGDSRVNAASEIQSRWEAEMCQSSAWLHANNDLRSEIYLE